jgi:OOP family OmpA-OmpF porin
MPADVNRGPGGEPTKHTRGASAAFAVFALCVPIFSAQAQTPGGYAGVGLGQSTIDIDGSALEQSLLDFAAAEGVAIASSSSREDDSDTAFKFFLGYRFNPNFAIEGALVDLGDFEASASATDVAFGDTLTVTTDVDFFAFAFSGLAHLPIGRTASLYGKFGIVVWDLEVTEHARLPGFVSSTGVSDDDGTDFLYGAGVEWGLSRQFALRAEWERYNDVGEGSIAGETDIDVVGFSGVFRW